MTRETLELQRVSGEGGPDDIERAMGKMRRRMRRATDPHPQHLEFLEDDLRESRAALAQVESYLDEVVALLANPNTRLTELVDLADDPAVLERLDEVSESIGNVRRRLLRMAAETGR